ncbi:MAG: dihydropteroate synthase [Proteobacteria bacterium]|nr:dihydropteroate synthase [Pseudomonadota bacterium]MDA1022316.1 dihydropteroate synthase [Pseudomonadota bacterium]
MNQADLFAGLSLAQPRILGIINATPDSFSDGGEAYALEDALNRGKEMLAAGADILDVGGESTRPNAKPISADEEISRVLPVIEGLAGMGALVSIDTRRAPVMRAAIKAGAGIINDISALTGDKDSLGVAAESGLSVILMHMQGDPGTMQDDPQYDDAAKDVYHYLADRIQACEAAGIDRGRIAVDPGIGFGKTLAHNLDILGRLSLYDDLGVPVLLGASRKSFIGKISAGDDPKDRPKDRLGGSIAACVAAYAQGVRLFRVHDVAETRLALAVFQAINEAGG